MQSQVPFFFAQDRLVLPGSPASKEPLSIPVKRFLSMLRFENRGTLDDLGVEIDTNTHKSGD